MFRVLLTFYLICFLDCRSTNSVHTSHQQITSRRRCPTWFGSFRNPGAEILAFIDRTSNTANLPICLEILRDVLFVFTYFAVTHHRNQINLLLYLSRSEIYCPSIHPGIYIRDFIPWRALWVSVPSCFHEHPLSGSSRYKTEPR